MFEINAVFSGAMILSQLLRVVYITSTTIIGYIVITRHDHWEN